MAGGGGVARLDGGDRGLHEALEEPLDLLVEHGVLDGAGGRPGQRLEQLLVLVAEVAVAPVERLDDADRLAPGVEHGDAEDVAGPVAGGWRRPRGLKRGSA